MAGAGGFFRADAQPEGAPISAPGELVQFVTATPAPQAENSSGERSPLFGRADDDRWDRDDHDAEEHEDRKGDRDDEHEEREEHEEWELEDDG